jgi:hypothetical protein
LDIPFLETSAKNATNVETAFLTMAAEIKNTVAKQPSMKTTKSEVLPLFCFCAPLSAFVCFCLFLPASFCPRLVV